MNKEVKSVVATVEADIPESDEFPFGGFTAVASTPSIDRDGDSLSADEWITPLPDHITIDIDHEMSVRGTVGSARPYFGDDGRLMIEAKFSSIDRAQETRTLVQEGHIRTVSVAFLTDRSKKSGEPRRELLNVGIVAIPSNRDAVILDSKAVDAVETGVLTGTELRELLSKAAGGGGDLALVQAIHDASVHLGAQCIVPPEPDGDENGKDSDSDGDGKSKSVDAVEVKEPVLEDELELVDVIDGPEVTVTVGDRTATFPRAAVEDIETFRAALDELFETTPQVSPVDSPADSVAAASPVEPAPTVDAVDDAAEAVAQRARALEMLLLTQSVLPVEL